MPASFLDLNSMVYVAAWVLIGLIVYWAEGKNRRPGRAWLVLHVVLGALMLPVFVWGYVQRSARAQAGKPARMRLNGSRPTLAASAATEEPVREFNPKKARKKSGGMGPRKR